MKHPGLTDQRDRVEISLPLETRFVSTLRVLSASLAADAGFSVDEIDDLRLAVSEVFSMMAAEQPNGRMTASFVTEGNALSVEIVGDGAAIALQPDELARNILDAVVDSSRFESGLVTFTKRAIEARSG